MERPINVFISYKWEDDARNKWVERLATDLRREGIDVVLDKWEVRLGDSFTDYMTSRISEADVVLFIMTSKAVAAVESRKGKGGALKFEMQIAAARRIAGEKMRLIPIYREGRKTAAHVRDHRYADFRDDRQYPQRLRELIEDLRGRQIAPPLGSVESFCEYATVGQDLGDNRLQAEFVSGKHDLLVWAEETDGPVGRIVRYLAQGNSYVPEPIESVAFATRIKLAAWGDLVVIQERNGLVVVDGATLRAKKRLSIDQIGEPIIRSEVLHPTLPVAFVGTDYGKVIAWNWEKDELLFAKRYFPREEIQWINSLAVELRNGCLLFTANNILFRVRLDDGEIVSQEPLGPGDETSGLAVCEVNGLLAVGGIMETRVYRLATPPQLAYSVPNGRPLAQEIRFSSDGKLLAILFGMSVGGNAATVRNTATGAVVCGFSDVYSSAVGTPKNLFSLSVRSISFSSDGQLIAVGEGGRIGIYSRNRITK